jgi:hypothetical protein
MGEGLLLSILNAILNKLNMFQEELRNVNRIICSCKFEGLRNI